MEGADPAAAAKLLHAGHHAEALALVRQMFADAACAVAPERPAFFMTMFTWELLAEAYAPARTALAALRDEQAARLLAGDLYCDAGVGGMADYRRTGRFSLVIQMNRILGDAPATHALFVQIETAQPALARSSAWQALPAMVEVGDFALADRYRGDPLALLDEVNDMARHLPLFPLPRTAPRLIADLMNLTGSVGIGMAVLRGLGRAAESDALGQALLGGLESGEVRALAARELIDPGTINRELVAHQMAQESS